MKESSCGMCQWSKESDLPFTGLICENRVSELYRCDVDPNEDICREFKEGKKYESVCN